MVEGERFVHASLAMPLSWRPEDTLADGVVLISPEGVTDEAQLLMPILQRELVAANCFVNVIVAYFVDPLDAEHDSRLLTRANNSNYPCKELLSICYREKMP